MAKTNVTTIKIPKTVGTSNYTISRVAAGLKSSINDTTINAKDEIIIVGNDAANNPLIFTAPTTITGDKNLVPHVIKNLKKSNQFYVGGVDFNGAMNISNVAIESAGAINFGNTSHVLTNVFIELHPNDTVQATLFRVTAGTMSIDGLIIVGGSFAFDNVVVNKLDNYSPRNMAEGFMTITNTNWLILEGFNPQSCVKDFGFSTQSRYVFYGYSTKAPTGGYHFNWPAGNSQSMAILRKELSLTIKNKDTKALVTNALAKFSDKPQNATLYNGATWFDNNNVRVDTPLLYSVKSSSLGVILLDLRLAFVGRAVGTDGINSPAKPVLYLSHATDFNYSYDIPIRIYGYKENITKYDVTGLAKRINKEVELEVETAVVNSNETQVYAYTQLENNDKLHDFWHSFFVINFDYTNLITKNGSTLSLEINWRLVIDKNATSVFNVDKVTKTITIKSSIYTGSFKTTGTGTIILKNGAILKGGTYSHVVLESGFSGTLNLTDVNITTLENKTGNEVLLVLGGISTSPTTLLATSGKLSFTDSTGTIVLPTGADTVTLHLLRTDADTGANPLSTGTVFNYRASVFANKVIYLRATSSTNPALEIIASHQVPVTIGSHSFSSLSFGENKQLKNIEAIVKIIQTDASSIKTKTDGLNFTGDYLKSTLDGEKVSLDTASQTGVANEVWKSDISVVPLGAGKEVTRITEQVKISVKNTQKD